MKIVFKNKFIYILILFLFVIGIGVVSASDNATDDVQLAVNDSVDVLNQENVDLNEDNAENDDKLEMSIAPSEDMEPISPGAPEEINISDFAEPNTYKSVVKVTPEKKDLNFAKTNYIFAKIKTKDSSTYYKSNKFFKAKILNNVDNTPIKGVKVLFKAYSANHKPVKYYATTDKNGVASLNKNLKVGKYSVHTYIKNKNAVFEKTKSTFIVKSRVGCCSYYIQVSGTEGVTGYRRDSVYSADMYMRPAKWYSRTAIRQYKYNGGYCFHTITTSDGWMIGTGGADNAHINKEIEKLAGKMVASGKIIKSSLYTIQGYIQSLGIGHFAIKSPNGDYAAVWIGSMKTGKLKAGEFISVPNSVASFRHGKFTKFDSNPGKAGLKIGASDRYGLNRRDITVYHWKATTKNFKTTSQVIVCAANDGGKLVGLSTGYLKDNIHYKGKFFSKNKLRKAPSMTLLGKHKFGNIDKIIKIQTVVKAPKVVAKFNSSKYFKIIVKDKKTNKAIKNIKIKVKQVYKQKSRIFTFKTSSRGVAKFPIQKFRVGTHKLSITTGDNRYIISKNSKIIIKE